MFNPFQLRNLFCRTFFFLFINSFSSFFFSVPKRTKLDKSKLKSKQFPIIFFTSFKSNLIVVTSQSIFLMIRLCVINKRSVTNARLRARRYKSNLKSTFICKFSCISHADSLIRLTVDNFPVNVPSFYIWAIQYSCINFFIFFFSFASWRAKPKQSKFRIRWNKRKTEEDTHVSCSHTHAYTYCVFPLL